MWSLDSDKIQQAAPAGAIDGGGELRKADPAVPATALRRSVPASQMGARSPSAAPDPAGLLRALRRRWKLALVGGIVAASLGGAAAYLLVPASKYTAKALVFVAEKPPKYLYDTRENLIAYRTYQETQTTLVTSQKVLRAALEKVGVASLPSLRQQEDPVAWLGEKIKVDFPRGSEILTISMTGDIPQDLASLVNHVTEAYLNLIVADERKERLARYERLKELSVQYQKDLAAKRAVYRSLIETVGTDAKQGDKANTQVTQQAAADRLFQTRQELFKIQSDIRQQRIKLRVQDADPRGQLAKATNAAAEPTRKDPAIDELETELASWKARKARAQRLVKNPRDPSLAFPESEIVRLQAEIDRRRNPVRSRPAAVAGRPAAPAQPAEPAEFAENRVYLKALE